ncbi:MAG: hypothetical protein MJE77_26910 [Proteobacteria bacterium]|nr:hypothetical protein [Pseudomonadota bacterium]
MKPHTLPYETIERAVLDYGAAWNEDDEGEIRKLLLRCFAADGLVISSREVISSRDALHARIIRWRREAPGHRAIFTSGIEHHHNLFRFNGVFLAPDGGDVIPLIDIGEVDADGRITRIFTFQHAPEPPAHWPVSLVK